MINWFHVALYLHILGFGGLIFGLGLELAGIKILRRAKTMPEIETANSILGRLGPVFGSSSLIILLSGLYLWQQVNQHNPGNDWVVVALVAFILTGIVSGIHGHKLSQALGDIIQKKNKAENELKNFLKGYSLTSGVTYSIWMIAGILCLMVFKPNLTYSIIIIGFTVIAGSLNALKR